MKIAAFTGGARVPSARFRVRQYIGPLHATGIDVTEFTARFGAYPPSTRTMRPIWGIASLASRVPSVLRSYAFDVTLLQREMISSYVTLEPATAAPRVLDVDDAIWLNGTRKFASRIANSCRAVICGNSFLAENF